MVDILPTRKAPNKFQVIFNFLNKVNACNTSNIIPLILLYCVKSAIKLFFMDAESASVSQTKFMSLVLKNFLKFLYSVSTDTLYFGIVSNNKVLSEFTTTVFATVMLNNPYLQVIVYQEGLKTVKHFSINSHSYIACNWEVKTLVNHTLPMVSLPRPWVLDKDNNYNFGGFLCNKLLFYPAVHLKSGTGSSVLKPKVIDCINLIQRNCYRVNTANLNVDIIIGSLTQYFKDDKGYKHQIFKVINQNIILKSFKTMLGEGPITKLEYTEL
jgi:hypothetical protein